MTPFSTFVQEERTVSVRDKYVVPARFDVFRCEEQKGAKMESCRLLCSISVESVILLLLWQTACQSVVAAVRSETKPPSFSLHYTTGGDRTEDGERQMPGLYSGRLLPANENNDGPNINSTFDDLRQLDFGCAQVGNTVHNGLSIKCKNFQFPMFCIPCVERIGKR